MMTKQETLKLANELLSSTKKLSDLWDKIVEANTKAEQKKIA